MIDYNPRDILISCHLPKCGGISFREVLKEWYGRGFHLHEADQLLQIPPHKPMKKLLLKRFLPVIIHGHFDKVADNIHVFDLYPKAKQFITVVRDPLERQLSLYYYTKKLIKEGKLVWKGKVKTDMKTLGETADEYLEMASPAKDCLRFLPWELNEHNYKEIIDKNFVHIGLTEDLQRSVDIFAEKLGKKKVKVPVMNTSNILDKPSESSIRKFKERHKLEYLVYDYAVSLNR